MPLARCAGERLAGCGHSVSCGQHASVDGVHHAKPLIRHRLRHQRHQRRHMTPIGRAVQEFRMQFPRLRVESYIHIVGIATFVEAVESSLNRIACETASRMRAHTHVGPLMNALVLGNLE